MELSRCIALVTRSKLLRGLAFVREIGILRGMTSVWQLCRGAELTGEAGIAIKKNNIIKLSW